MFALLLSATMFAQQTRPAFQGDGMLQAMQTTQLDEQGTRAPGDVKFTEGFETTTGTALPTGWIVSHSGTADSWITVANGTDNIPGVTGTVPTHSGDRMLALSWQQTGRDAWAISSGFSLTAGTSYFVSFWLYMPGYQGPPPEISGLECKIGQTNTPAGMASASTVYYNNKTQNVSAWTKITGYFLPTTSGTYYLGFHDLSAAGTGLYTVIDDISVFEPSIMNDLVLQSTNPLLPCTKIPASQMAGFLLAGKTPFPKAITVPVFNAGGQAQTNVSLSATFNGVSTGNPATLSTIAPTAIVPMVLNTPMVYPTAAGNYNFVYNLTQTQTDENPADNTATYTFGIGDKYQLDNVTTFDNGVGANGATLTLGNIFTIYNTTTLTDVEIGFMDAPPYEGTAISISLFPMTNATTAGTATFTQNATRPAGGFVTITLTTPRTLNPGDYFMAVNQISTTSPNITVCYDTRPGSERARSKTYSATGAGGALTTQTNFGALAIRMITSGGTTPTVYQIVGKSNNYDWGSVAGVGAYNANAAVTLTAKAKYGYEFVQWSDGSTVNPYPTFNATADFTITAIFQEKNTCVDKIVGTGTSTTYVYPINTYYGYSYTQQIYSAADIGKTGMIKSISLEYIHATEYTSNVDIYMGVTKKNTFASATMAEMIPLADMQLVYSGPISLKNATQWSKITLDTPFPYTCDNVVVAIYNKKNANIGNSPSFRVSTPTPAGNYTFNCYRDNTPINPAAPEPTLYVQTARANMKFEVCDLVACADKQIGTGTTTQRIYPIDHFYNYSYVQEIFLASEIGIPAGAITSLSFQHGNFAGITKVNQTVYLANITKSAFGTTGSASEWIPGAQLTKVWGGTITMAQNSWVTITFDEPFEYNGGNLVVAFLNLAGSFGTSDARYLTHATPDRKTFYWSSDSNFPGINTPPGSGTNYATVAFRNNIIFNLCSEQSLVDMEAVSITGPQAVIALDQATYTVTVKNNAPVAAKSYTVNVLDATNTILGSTVVTTPLAPGATATVNVSFVFPATMGGNQNIKGEVVIGCDAKPANNVSPTLLVGIIDFCVDLNKITKGTQIGNGTTTSTTHPFAFYYRGGATQTIYSAADLNVPAGTIIKGLSFKYAATTALENSPQIKVYLANTTQSNFASTTSWLPLTQFIQVYSNTVNIPTGAYELQLTFDVPFIYTGGTLCVMTEKVLDLVLAYTNNVLSQQTASTPTNRVLYYQNDSAPWSSSVTGTLSSNVPNAIFHFAKDSKELSVDYTVTGEGEVNVILSPIPPVCGSTVTVTITPANDCTEITAIKFNGVTQPLQTSYTFPNQNVPLPVITIETIVPHFNIVATASGNGVIIPPAGTYNVLCGDSLRFDFKPDKGYMVDYVEVDGAVIPKTMNDFYEFKNIIKAHTIHVAFKLAPYNIYFSAVGNGQIIPVGKLLQIPYGQIGVGYGDMQQFIFTPGSCQVIQAVYVDGVLNQGALITGSYMFVNIQGDHDIMVVFKPEDKTIVATVGPNGTITPAGNVLVPCGSNKEFTIKANGGYVIDQLLVDGNSEPVGNEVAQLTYTFQNVTEPHTIYATFKVATMKIKVSWTGCGTSTISPTGTGNGGYVYVPYNVTQIITFVPDEGCKVTEVLVDGAPYPQAIATGSYTFYYVHEDHEIKVTFTKETYPVTAQINAYGYFTMGNPGITNVAHGEDITYKYVPSIGYKIANVFVDGTSNLNAAAAGEYTFEKVKKPHTLDIITEQLTYNINAKVVGDGGYITPQGNIKVVYGQSQTFVITTAPGYEIDKVLVDNVPNGEAAQNGIYTFINVKEAHTIEVYFKVSRYMVEAIVTGGGLIEPAGITEVTYFDEIIYTITPNEGYKISSVHVNGSNLGAINTYTFSEVEANGNIEAFFELIPNDPNIISESTIDGITIYNHANIVYITNAHLLPIQDVTIADMYGRVVWKGKIYNEKNVITLDVANGVYTVRVATDEQFTATKVTVVR